MGRRRLLGTQQRTLDLARPVLTRIVARGAQNSHSHTQ